MSYQNDPRSVMTLDAGGTNFVFNAIKGGKEIIEDIHMPSAGNNLDLCLANLRNGFHAVRSRLTEMGETPVAISFAFPGPTDYPNGIIGDLVNLPAFRGGVAVGPMLEEEFKIPVFMNNDGDLFAFGEALAGYLPWINKQLEEAGSPKRYKNLVGFTLGTGFGCGIVRNNELFMGDNSAGVEVYQMSQRYYSEFGAEECVSIRAIKRVYAQVAGIDIEKVPSPKDIYEIGIGAAEGNKDAAIEAFRRMGQALGDILCNLLTLVDGIAVIGGGVSGASPLIVPAILDEVNSRFVSPSGRDYPRFATKLFYTDDEIQLKEFLKGDVREIQVPHSERRITYDPMSRVGFGFSQMGTSRAISLGAYCYALSQLDK